MGWVDKSSVSSENRGGQFVKKKIDKKKVISFFGAKIFLPPKKTLSSKFGANRVYPMLFFIQSLRTVRVKKKKLQSTRPRGIPCPVPRLVHTLRYQGLISPPLSFSLELQSFPCMSMPAS